AARTAARPVPGAHRTTPARRLSTRQSAPAPSFAKGPELHTPPRAVPVPAARFQPRTGSGPGPFYRRVQREKLSYNRGESNLRSAAGARRGAGQLLMRHLIYLFVPSALILLTSFRLAFAFWQWPRVRQAGGLVPVLLGGLRIAALMIAALCAPIALLAPWLGHHAWATTAAAGWCKL